MVILGSVGKAADRIVGNSEMWRWEGGRGCRDRREGDANAKVMGMQGLKGCGQEAAAEEREGERHPSASRVQSFPPSCSIFVCKGNPRASCCCHPSRQWSGTSCRWELKGFGNSSVRKTELRKAEELLGLRWGYNKQLSLSEGTLKHVGVCDG